MHYSCMSETPGKRIREIREGYGYSRADLAAASGVPEASIIAWEHERTLLRKHRPRHYQSVKKIANALGIPDSQIWGETPAIVQLSSPPGSRSANSHVIMVDEPVFSCLPFIGDVPSTSLSVEKVLRMHEVIGQYDPGSFVVRVGDNANAPRLPVGAYAIVKPSNSLMSGVINLVKLKGTACIAQVERAGESIRLVYGNGAVAPDSVTSDQVDPVGVVVGIDERAEAGIRL